MLNKLLILKEYKELLQVVLADTACVM